MQQVLTAGQKHAHALLTIDWIERNIERPEISAVLAKAITPTAAPKIIELGRRYVHHFMTHPASGPVPWSLSRLRRTSSFYRTLDLWLQTAADPATALLIYVDQLRSDHRQRYATRALNWIEDHTDVPGSHELLARLVACRVEATATGDCFVMADQ